MITLPSTVAQDEISDYQPNSEWFVVNLHHISKFYSSQEFQCSNPQILPHHTIIVAVAVSYFPPPQHSPILGHLASSHTCHSKPKIHVLYGMSKSTI